MRYFVLTLVIKLIKVMFSINKNSVIKNITNIKILVTKANSGCEIQDVKCCKTEQNTYLKCLNLIKSSLCLKFNKYDG